MDTKESILKRIIPGIAEKLGVDEKEIGPARLAWDALEEKQSN